MGADWAVEMTGISKSYGGVRALSGVDLRVERGSVHALLGENGAGKSTLMKIMMGMARPDSGEIRVMGEAARLRCPNDAKALGLSMVFQEINTVGHMTVADNVFLGREPLLGGTRLVDKRRMREEASRILAGLGADIRPDDLPARLSVANNQLVEIAKAVSFGARVIAMDEPTSALSEVEAANLFRVVRELSASGVTIVYISHKLDEIFEICDGVTVLRDGKNAGAARTRDADRQGLISLMVGREVKDLFPKEVAPIGEPLLEVRGLGKKGQFEDVSFSVRSGEILGIAGLMGAGRTEVAETVYGLRRADSGEVLVRGRKLRGRGPREAIEAGIALVPEDRKNVGLALRLPVKDNVIAASLSKCSRGPFMDPALEAKHYAESAKRLEIKAAGPSVPCSSLSGGNQQKVVIAKCLLADPDVIILDEPTRGIDVGTKSQIHALMSRFAKEGKAVVMISSELPEILGMSDRVLVLHEGRVAGELSRAEATAERVMEMAMGERPAAGGVE